MPGERSAPVVREAVILRPNLLRVLSHREGPRIRGNEFIHGGLELCALPIRVTCNRSAQAFELLSEDSVSQRLSTYVEIAIAVCLCHLGERPYDHFRRIVRI